MCLVCEDLGAEAKDGAQNVGRRLRLERAQNAKFQD